MNNNDDEVIQIVIHPALRPALEEWIKSRGLRLFPIQAASDEELATYGIGPKVMPR